MVITSKITVGNRFDRLVVVSRTAERKWGQVVWLCQCDCGNKSAVASRNLSSGKTRSCGCLRHDATRERNQQSAWHDLRREIAELATKHHLEVGLPAGEVTWKTKLAVTCPRCGRRRL